MPSKNLNSLSHPRLIGILFLLSYVFLMFGNGALSLTHPDEVFYIQSAKEMLARNSWMTPYIFDAPQFEKPILSYWLFMLAIKIFGLGSFAGRFAPALFGMFGVVAIYGIAWVLFKNKRLAFLAGLLLMSSFIHLAMSRAVLTDMIFSVWVTLAIGAFYWAYDPTSLPVLPTGRQNFRLGASKDLSRKNTGIVFSFIFSGIAILSKGLLGFCFPAGVILIFLLLKKDLKFLKTPSLLLGFVLLLAIAVPWHILMFKLYGQVFLDEYFKNVHIRRILEAEHQKSNTWYFYLGTVIGGVMPWAFFLFSAMGVMIRALKERARDYSQFLFLLSWIIGIFIFVQPAQSKLASYILPIFPAVIIILAYYVEKILSSSEGASGGENPSLQAGFLRAGYLLTAVLTLAIIAIPIAAKKFPAYMPSNSPLLFSAFIFMGLAFFIFWNLRKKNFYRVVCILPGITAAMLGVAILAKPYAEPWVSCEGISQALQKIDPGDSTVLTSKFFVRGVKYYTDRRVAVIDINGKQFFSPHPLAFLNRDDKVNDFLKSQPVTFCIVKHSNVRDLKRIAANGNFSLTEIEGIGGKFLLKIENKKP